MKNILFSAVLSFVFVTAPHGADVDDATPAQDPAAETSFKDADAAFSTLAALTTSGFAFSALLDGTIDKTMAFQHLSEGSRWTANVSQKVGVFNTSGGFWSATNETGTVGIKLTMPSLVDSTKAQAEVVFLSPSKQTMPAVLFSHLLGKAERTTLKSGNTIDLEFAVEHSNLKIGCWSTRTLTFSLDTGAYVSTQLLTFCDLPK